MRWFILLLALLLPGLAAAHTQLVRSDPAEGAVLAAPPEMVVLTFGEPVTPLVLRWFGPDGRATDVTGEAQGVNVLATPPEVLPPGSQALSWRVASTDGHPVGGTLSFAIGHASGGIARATTQPSARYAAGARWLLTLALVLGVGGSLFAALVGDAGPRAGRVSAAGSLAALPLALLAAGLHGADILGVGPASLATPSPWVAVMGTRFLLTIQLAVTAALLALAGLTWPARAGQALAVLGWLAAAASFAVSGHATTPVRMAAVAVHTATFLYWLGALPPLLLAVATTGLSATLLLRRFSFLALPLVALLVLSGALLTLAEARSPADLFASGWGRLLIAKLVLVALMLALAALNRRRLTGRLAQGDPTPIRRSIAAEIALGLVVLALASGFRVTGPPQPAIPALPGPSVHLHGDPVMAQISFDSPRPGPNRVAVELLLPPDADPPEASLTLALPEAGIEPIRLKLVKERADLWGSDPFSLPVAGQWTLALRILIDDFTSIGLGGSVEIAP